MQRLEIFWYFWKDDKAIAVDINKIGWSRPAWVGILFYTPDHCELVARVEGKNLWSPYIMLERTSGAQGVHEDEVPPNIRMKALLLS